MVLKGVTSKASMILLGEKTPKKRGIIPTATGGVGVDVMLKTFDNFVGSPLQRFASFNLPFIGPVGPIDAINFLIFSAGGRNIKGGIIAVAAAKLITGGASLGNITGFFGGTSSPNVSQGSPVASGVAGAPV